MIVYSNVKIFTIDKKMVFRIKWIKSVISDIHGDLKLFLQNKGADSILTEEQ